MPVLFSYLLKVSLSLGLVYFFYRLILYNLTFYSWNRWYLLGFSVLSFFLPLIDIAVLIESTQTNPPRLMSYVPALESYTTRPLPDHPVMAETTEKAALEPWPILLFIFLTGIFILLVKVGVQLFFYLKFKKSAQLVSSGSIEVYQVNQHISPFSFGRAIFLNQSLHSDAELAEIIRHEFVHVKQGHTLDIIWAEVMCILNWYNPFAWFLRHSIRQNLEFIADNQVVQSGINKKEYQYLLLKITGAPEFCLTNQFSFLSLKKRIAMMNKMPNPRAHLVKFLLVLPLLALSLIAFRRVKDNNLAPLPKNQFIPVSGLVVNAETLEPLSNAHLIDEYSKTETLTDSRGYYTLKIPVSAYPVKTEIKVKKPGFTEMHFGSKYKASPKEEAGRIEFVGLVIPEEKDPLHGAFVSVYPAPESTIATFTVPSYEAVLIRFKDFKERKKNETDLEALVKDSEKPYWVVNGNSYLVSAAGSYASTDEITDIVFVDGKRMTGEEVNRTLKRSTLGSGGAMGEKEAFKNFGINKSILLAYTISKNNKPISNQGPKSGFNVSPGTKEKLKSITQQKNPAGNIDAKNIIDIKPGEKQIVTLIFKDGTQEKYDLATETGKQAYEKAQRLTVGGYSTKDPSRMPEDYKAFLIKNPQVKVVRWRFDRATNSNRPDLVVLTLKSGAEEVYSLLNKAETEAAEKRYGKFPKPAPPPPRIDIVKFKQNTQQKAGAKPFAPPVITPDQLPADHKDFLSRNTQIKTIGWQGQGLIVLFLKSGKQEKYNVNKVEGKTAAETKYGRLPKPPFPPPAGKNYSFGKNNQAAGTAIGLPKANFKVKGGFEDKFDLIRPPAVQKDFPVVK